VEGFERPKRYLWNLMRGPVADPAVCRKEALGAYAKWAARSGLDEGRFAEQADVRCKVFDLTCRDDREAAVTDLCGVLERCARVGSPHQGLHLFTHHLSRTHCLMYVLRVCFVCVCVVYI
jgi:hypothetical protein